MSHGLDIEAYSLDNPHAAGYSIPYIPDAKFGFVTDIWSPAPRIPPANPGTIALVKGIQKMGSQMDRIAGGHGAVGNFADLARQLRPRSRNRCSGWACACRPPFVVRNRLIMGKRGRANFRTGSFHPSQTSAGYGIALWFFVRA